MKCFTMRASAIELQSKRAVGLVYATIRRRFAPLATNYGGFRVFDPRDITARRMLRIFNIFPSFAFLFPFFLLSAIFLFAPCNSRSNLEKLIDRWREAEEFGKMIKNSQVTSVHSIWMLMVSMEWSSALRFSSIPLFKSFTFLCERTLTRLT